MLTANTSRNIAARGQESQKLLFSARLATTIQPEACAGQMTFTRTSTAVVEDFEGLLKTVKSGEARFRYGRRVANLLSKSELMADAVWLKDTASTGVTPVLTDGYVTGPTGNATRVQLSRSGAGFSRVWQSLSSIPTSGPQTIVQSLWMRTASGSGSQVVGFRDGTAAVTNQYAVTVSGTWQRFSFTFSHSAAGQIPAFEILTWDSMAGTSTSIDIVVCGCMSEFVDGQANQNPSEYVSNGVLPAPYHHGTAVDGVKYFDYTNGNTVSSNIVTEAKGAPFAQRPMYFCEGARTNLLLQSETLDNAIWTKSGATVTANNTVGPDGLSNADKIVEDTATTTHEISQAITKSASALVYTLSVYAKANGRNLVLDIGNAGNGARTVFNLSTGAVAVAAATYGTGFASASSQVTLSANGFYLCRLTVTSDATTSLTSRAQCNSGTTLNNSYAGNVASGIYLWGAQLEQATTASTYIKTTTSAVGRADDIFTIPVSRNFNDTTGSCRATYLHYPSADVTQSYNERLIGFSNTATPLSLNGTLGVSLVAFDVTSAVTVSTGSSASNSAASKWGSARQEITGKGSSAPASGNYDGSYSAGGDGLLYLGGAANTHFFGSIYDVKIWGKARNNLQALVA